ncbi:YciI family protein [Leptospira johnsonii]|uniref:YCII-related domain-containing protein n=1 Tax=Leptospira johnsonii TaxID=1917820 RepID=A0A2P2D2D4_9LEPT|nr:hypothetical protein [Leptospira johnsonii]GBF38812.1 hypothetical protein LPTSP1_18060 [Leptospira johnsonii]
MYIVLLKFDFNKSKAPQLMGAHNEWIKNGFEDGHFILVGSLKPGLGGAILVQNISREDLEERISADPFVAENVVKAEILEVEPSKVVPSLEFLVGSSKT